MANDPRLESYLESLERALKPFPTSERAEIVTELKSHVLSAMERDPEQNLDTVLQALGQPETVANRYLLERGSAPVKPPISPIVKWIVVGFLGTLAMIFLFVGFFLYQARHLVKIDAQNDRISVLNGLIDVDGKNDQVRIGGQVVSNGGMPSGVVSGFLSANPELKSALIRFNAGKLKLVAGGSHGIDWSCSGVFPDLKKPAQVNGQVTLDFTSSPGVDCTVKVPSTLATQIDGKMGSVVVDARPPSKYRYQLRVGMGQVEGFPKNENPKDPLIQIELGAGKIENAKSETGSEE